VVALLKLWLCHLLPPSSFLMPVSVEFYGEFYDIKYADVTKRECESFMRCEKSFIPMKLHWHSYLVLSLGNCVHKTCTETGLRQMISNSRDQGNNGALRQGLKPALIMHVRMQASLQLGHQLTSCQDPNRTPKF
jgi:hypothetical protein